MAWADLSRRDLVGSLFNGDGLSHAGSREGVLARDKSALGNVKGSSTLCTSFELSHSAETWIELLSILGVPLLSSVCVYNLQGCSGCKSTE